MDKLTASQRDCLRFGAIAAPMALACGGKGVLWAVPALALAALADWAVRRRLPAGRSLAEVLPRWALLLELLFLIAAAAAVAAMTPLCWPNGSWPLFPLALLVLAGAAVRPGTGAVGRCAVPVAWGCILFLGLVLAAALPEAKPQPARSWNEGLPVLTVALLGVCGQFLPSEREKPGRLWLGLALFTLPLLALGKDLRTAVRSIELFGVLQRFEALVSCALTAGLFLALALLAASAGEILRALGLERATGAAVLVPAAALIFWIAAVPGWVLAAGAGLFWGVLPLLAQGIGGSGDGEKSPSKSEKKC